MTKSMVLVLAMATMVMAYGCKKEVPGPKGATGATGPAGTNGINGVNGNTNVQAYTYTANNLDWQSQGTNGQPGCGVYFHMSVPAITSDIATKGAVLIYEQNITYGQQLPFTLFFNGWQRQFVPSSGVGLATVKCFDSNLILPTLGTYTYKVVVIEGTPRLLAPGLNWSNYEAVKKHFALVETIIQ